ncbi:hypothetical protein JXR93_13075 [bacterium]|nr:hypothetical protein [bacterium]
MKRTLFNSFLLLFFLFSTIVYSKGVVEEHEKGKVWFVTIDKLPTTLEEFTALRDEIAVTPQGGMVSWLVAQLIMIDNPELGEQCVVITTDKSLLVESFKLKPKEQRTNVKGWQLGSEEVNKMMTTGFSVDKAYAAKTYVIGTSHKEEYKLPELPFKYIVTNHSIQKKGGLSGEWNDTWHGFVNESGTDSGKLPFFVKKDSKGIWKMFKSSSFFAGTKDPIKKVVDDL